ncbi:MAG TPA: DUF3574 domain-containing protein [Candidatus Manganitrophaceae bacterium]|nr:DUF3574 domain-containing protein [Candidatus Manganitrophaceae bacterium]
MVDHFRKRPPCRRLPVLFGLFLLFLPLWGCAADGYSRPIPPLQNRQGAVLISDTFFFGLSTARGPVSRAEWEAFLRDIVTPRFPDGLTYWEANGQWRGARNELVQERTMVLQILHPDNFQNESAVQEIIGRYKAQFEQDSVLRLRDAVQVWY